jgi:predicted transcriptional regulator
VINSSRKQFDDFTARVPWREFPECLRVTVTRRCETVVEYAVKEGWIESSEEVGCFLITDKGKEALADEVFDFR